MLLLLILYCNTVNSCWNIPSKADLFYVSVAFCFCNIVPYFDNNIHEIGCFIRVVYQLCFKAIFSFVQNFHISAFCYQFWLNIQQLSTFPGLAHFIHFWLIHMIESSSILDQSGIQRLLFWWCCLFCLWLVCYWCLKSIVSALTVSPASVLDVEAVCVTVMPVGVWWFFISAR